MKPLKKVLAFAMIAALALVALSACSSNNDATSNETAPDPSKLQVVCTTYPQYDWVRQIIGETDNVEVTLLLDNGVDLHSYQPTVADIATISSCDMFVYVGGVSDEWVADALRSATNEDMIVVNMVEAMGDAAKEEEIKEGMEHGHDTHAEGETHEHEGDADHSHDEAADAATEEGHDHADEADHDHETTNDSAADTDNTSSETHVHEGEVDEHVWLSLKNARSLVGTLAEDLGQLDADNAATYTANAEAYQADLDALDARYQETVDSASQNTLLFGDRFPFRYMVDDYGLDYFAAFSGCSAETEASFSTIIFLAEKINELGLPHVMTVEDSDQTIARTIIENTETKDQDTLVLDSMQSIQASDVSAGTSYLSIMEKNLETLATALNQ